MLTNLCRVSSPGPTWTLLFAVLLASCGNGNPQRFPPTFFVERVPSGSPDSVPRAGLAALYEQGTPSASVTLNSDTRRALTPPVPSRLTFAVNVPPQAALDFSFAVATEGTPERWPAVRFRVALNDGGGEKTVFQETAEISQRNRWLDRTLDLAGWEGREARILFEIGTEDSPDSPDSVVTLDPYYVMWGNPILYSRGDRRVRPPIILISVDCLRADHMKLYGYERDTTPHLDSFSMDSVVFEAASSASSWTLPAHMSMLTGLTPSFHAVSRERKLATSIAYLPQILSAAGYEIDGVVSGAYLSPSFGFERGFHNYRVLREPRAEEVVDETLGLLARTEGRDFFFFVHLFDPHWRYLPPEDFVERFGPRPPELDALLNKVIDRQPPAGPEDIERLENLYDGEVAYVDRELGRLLDGLRARGLYEDALIIVTSDHGEAFYEHGHWQHSETLYQEMIRVPLIVKWPIDKLVRPRRIEEAVSLIDLFPTILEVAGLPSADTQGKTLARYLEPSPPAGSGTTVSEVIWWSSEQTGELTGKKIALRSRDLKYIATFRGEPGDDLAIGEMVQEELYDLTADPEEKNNLEKSHDMAAFRKELHAHLEQARRFRADQQSGGTVVVDESIREQLKALGYIQ
ncbi:MAG: sulfatase [Vicinamibacteria bacterium]